MSLYGGIKLANSKLAAKPSSASPTPTSTAESSSTSQSKDQPLPPPSDQPKRMLLSPTLNEATLTRLFNSSFELVCSFEVRSYSTQETLLYPFPTTLNRLLHLFGR